MESWPREGLGGSINGNLKRSHCSNSTMLPRRAASARRGGGCSRVAPMPRVVFRSIIARVRQDLCITPMLTLPSIRHHSLVSAIPVLVSCHGLHWRCPTCTTSLWTTRKFKLALTLFSVDLCGVPNFFVSTCARDTLKAIHRRPMCKPPPGRWLHMRSRLLRSNVSIFRECPSATKHILKSYQAQIQLIHPEHQSSTRPQTLNTQA